MKLMPQKIHFCQHNLLLLLLLVFLGACATQQAVPEPQDTYSNKSAYLEDRQALLLTDSLMAFDAELTLSPREQAVNEKMVKLRTTAPTMRAVHRRSKASWSILSAARR